MSNQEIEDNRTKYDSSEKHWRQFTMHSLFIYFDPEQLISCPEMQLFQKEDEWKGNIPILRRIKKNLHGERSKKKKKNSRAHH